VTIDDPHEALPEIDQFVVEVGPDESLNALCWVLKRYPHESALVFCNYKTTVLELQAALTEAGLSVGRLDGDMDQFHRDQVLARFRNQSVRLLIATDVAGRGIDVDGLDLVVNYELPAQPDVYVHRIGRTGRAGKKGVTVALTNGRQQDRLAAIEALTGKRPDLLRRSKRDDPGLRALLESVARPAPMQTILISGGRKDKVRPGDILGALTGSAGGLKAADIGKIEIQDRLSYVAVARRVGRHATKQLNVGRIKNKRFRATLILAQDPHPGRGEGRGPGRGAGRGEDRGQDRGSRS